MYVCMYVQYLGYLREKRRQYLPTLPYPYGPFVGSTVGFSTQWANARFPMTPPNIAIPSCRAGATQPGRGGNNEVKVLISRESD